MVVHEEQQYCPHDELSTKEDGRALHGLQGASCREHGGGFAIRLESGHKSLRPRAAGVEGIRALGARRFHVGSAGGAGVHDPVSSLAALSAYSVESTGGMNRNK